MLDILEHPVRNRASPRQLHMIGVLILKLNVVYPSRKFAKAQNRADVQAWIVHFV